MTSSFFSTPIKKLLAFFIIYFGVLNSYYSIASDASTPCIRLYDGEVSEIEKKCEERIKIDPEYRRKQYTYLWTNFPECDTSKDEIINGIDEEECAKKAKINKLKREEITRIDEEKKLGKELFEKCDANNDGIISGREVICKIKLKTAQTEADTARIEADTARTEADTARTEADTARTRERIDVLKSEIGKKIEEL